jgi:hypothetical protein
VFFNPIQRRRSRYTASRNDRQPRTAETFDLNKPDWRADAAQRCCLIDQHPVRKRRSCLGILRNGFRHNHLAAATLMCCWKLGLIVSELLIKVARHARSTLDIQNCKAELMLANNVAKCGVSDNGSAPEPIRRGRGLAIISELASGLGGRVHASCTVEGSSFLLSFPLTRPSNAPPARLMLVC